MNFNVSLMKLVYFTAISEVAFLNSIISAGVMYTLTLNCSMGHFQGCTCDSTKTGSEGTTD